MMECLSYAQQMEQRGNTAFGAVTNSASPSHATEETIKQARQAFEKAIEFYFTAGDAALEVEEGRGTNEADAIMQRGYNCMSRLEEFNAAVRRARESKERQVKSIVVDSYGCSRTCVV